MNGRCFGGKHTDRNLQLRKTFRKKLIDRDACCIATGDKSLLVVAALIIPLNKSELIARNLQSSPRNGVLLLDALEEDYEKNMWFFDHDGKVTVLFPNWAYKDTIRSVNISKDPKIGPSKDLIDMHNKMALKQVKHYCTNCWKCVGAVNLDDHIAADCSESDDGYSDV